MASATLDEYSTPREQGPPFCQSPGEHHGGLALLRREADVATRESQAVAFAHDRAAHNVDRERQVGHHLAHDGQLLEVLLAEIGPARSGDGEELGHDGGDPVEMAGSRRPFPPFADADNRNRRGNGRGPVRVHLTHRGSEHHVDARCGAHFPVPVQGAGVVRDVLGVTELEGVDENADRDDIVLGPRPGHERDVTGMQGAHRRDQPDGAAGGPGLLEQFAAFGHGLDDPHDSDHRRDDRDGGTGDGGTGDGGPRRSG